MSAKGNVRFAVAVVVLLTAAVFLHARGRNEVFPPRQPLSVLPREFQKWRSRDLSIPPDQLQVLGPGDFLLRDYQSTSSSEPPIGLFIAYFPTQRAGDTIHSPKNCLPGAGWAPVETARIQVSLSGQDPFPANRYVIAKGPDRQLVLYWYLAHNRAVASEYWAKYYLVADSIRMNRSDGSLVRLSTPILRSERPDQAQERLLSFAGLIVPRLDDYIPR
jgi:EpsI family protein